MEMCTSSRAADFTKKDKNALQEVKHVEEKQLLVGMVGISLCCSQKIAVSTQTYTNTHSVQQVTIE